MLACWVWSGSFRGAGTAAIRQAHLSIASRSKARCREQCSALRRILVTRKQKITLGEMGRMGMRGLLVWAASIIAALEPRTMVGSFRANGLAGRGCNRQILSLLGRLG